MRYEGKEICQGCKKPGYEVSRREKGSLCPVCLEKYIKGCRVDVEEKIEYIGIHQHYFAYSGLHFNDNTLNEACIELLKAINNPFAKPKCYEWMAANHGDNRTSAIIPVYFYRPLQDFLRKMNEYVLKIRKEKDSIPELVEMAIQVEKDKIFNEGIEKGRKLLFQLNSGEITANELNTNYSYNEKNKCIKGS